MGLTKLDKDDHIFQGKFDPQSSTSVITRADNYLGKVSGFGVYVSRLLDRDTTNGVEDYLMVFPQGAYGLQMGMFKSKFKEITNMSFNYGINTNE